jgi:hypothetical protein
MCNPQRRECGDSRNLLAIFQKQNEFPVSRDGETAPNELPCLFQRVSAADVSILTTAKARSLQDEAFSRV